MSVQANELQEQPAGPDDGKLKRAMRTNRILLAVVVTLLMAITAIGGWFVGRSQQGLPPAGANAHANCPFDLPPRGQALVRGIRCSHGTMIVDAHCEDGHSMKRFILELTQQGASDDDIKAALLRRYGEKALAGREW